MMYNARMTLTRFCAKRAPQLGVLDGNKIYPLDLELGETEGVEVVLGGGNDAAAAALARARTSGNPIAADSVQLLAPVPKPSKIFGVGLNYADHVAESGLERPEVPAVFAKFPSAVAGPGDPIYSPLISDKTDYEGELCIVIGRGGRRIPVERAFEAIGGYMITNDVSVRDWQLKNQHWSLGKSFDSHSPTGPWLTLTGDVDPSNLTLRTWVNDELRQSSNTRNLIFGSAELVAHLSLFCTLLPGDLIATGTPGGVGAAMDPPRYLAPGDEVRIEIEGLGTLANPVVAETEDGGSVSPAASNRSLV